MQTPTNALIYHSSILTRPVIDSSASEKLGRVTQIWLDYQIHKVVGFTSQLGIWDHNPCTFPWEQIAAIEDQTILVKGIPTNHLNAALSLELEMQTAVDIQINHEVWTDTGNYVGQVSNCRINPHSGAVRDYILTTNSWRQFTRPRFYLPPTQIVDVGRGWIMVPDTVMQEIKPIKGKQSVVGKFPTALA